MDEASVFECLESEFLKSAPVRYSSQSWNGPCEKPLDTFDLCYELLVMGKKYSRIGRT